MKGRITVNKCRRRGSELRSLKIQEKTEKGRKRKEKKRREGMM